MAFRIESDRRYAFPLDRAELWAHLAAVDRYPGWWPWLHDLDAPELRRGSIWRCRIDPPVPYALRLLIRLDHVEEHRRIDAVVAGDLRGWARVDLVDRPSGRGCTVRLRSGLAPANGALRAFASVAAPVVRRGHDWVLDTGARQFRRQVTPGVNPSGGGRPADG